MEKARILLDSPAQAPVLGFDQTAIALATLIEQSEPRFAVGIFGGWGSGKTTLMDAIGRELNREDTLKVAFNAWRYEREHHLIVPLLDTIRGELVEYAAGRPADTREKVVAVASKVGRVVRALSMGMSAEVSVGVAKVVFDAAKFAEAVKDAPPTEPQSLYYACFEQLKEAFQELRCAGVERVVVFVDDLDRCLPGNALAVIESMKLFFDLIGFVFVVGIDRVVLEQAVRERVSGQIRGSGEPLPAMVNRRTRLAEREYIKKIFQVPYEVPPMAAEQLDELLESISRTGQLEGEQLDDLRSRVRPYLSHIAVEGQVNPREVKRFINAYTLQMLVRPHLQAATVLAVQTLVFRDDWTLYEILRAETDAVAEAIRRYRDADSSALLDLWPEIGTLPADMARFLRSPEARPLQQPNLRSYLTSVEATVQKERWAAEAYGLVAQLRRGMRELVSSLQQGVGANNLDEISRDLATLVAALRASVPKVDDGDRLGERLTAFTDQIRRLHGAMNADATGSWATQAESTLSDIQLELRLLRSSSFSMTDPG
ncbi:KAP family P-loop NTPase fold protein [Catellatospora sichuanensis]|uniref:KAP family P-loop NTPase fold protein n=1 Tax=Catellatospora sichuanensis TaxID=1969805 RepID=UPI001642CC09|nr:P-loop NTPase fold protein [Catellatospora sichuanensis]